MKEKIYHLDVTGRILAVDVGARRVGLAISDASRTLARPLETITVSGATDAVDRVARRIEALHKEEDGIATIVVGMPSSLDGTPTPQTASVQAFIAALKSRTPLPIATEDERLSSREAESRLAVREKDWRKRKQQLDAVAAAVFLQDYLDRVGHDERRAPNGERR
jgi:putative Holliday junction resolvase